MPDIREPELPGEHAPVRDGPEAVDATTRDVLDADPAADGDRGGVKPI